MYLQAVLHIVECKNGTFEHLKVYMLRACLTRTLYFNLRQIKCLCWHSIPAILLKKIAVNYNEQVEKKLRGQQEFKGTKHTSALQLF